MSWFLQRTLSCFYCGGASDHKYRAGLDQWRCRRCDAVNYLDEHGNITDPPALDVGTEDHTTPSRPARDGLQSFQPPEGSLFCSTCLKNQHLYQEALKAYLPPDEEDAADYDAVFAEYRRSLEARYPQVCLECEPRVRAAMKDAQYLAKTDHLRRMVQATQDGRTWHAKRMGWRWVLYLLGGLMWSAGVLLQLLWHAAAFAVVDELGEERMDIDGVTFARTLRTNRLGRCYDYRLWPPAFTLQRSCLADKSGYVAWSLAVSLLSIWWKPQLASKVSHGKAMRLTRLFEHLVLQIVVLLARSAALVIARNRQAWKFRANQIQAVHFFIVILIFITTPVSLNIVKAIPRKQKLFTDDIPMLVPSGDDDSTTTHTTSGSFDQFTTSRQTNLNGGYKRFPIHKLADPPTYSLPPAITSSPLPEDDGASVSDFTSVITDPENAMDWTPTSTWQPRDPAAAASVRSRSTRMTTRQATLRSQQQSQQSARPSPFYGALPPRPQAPAARIVNPYTSVFQRPSEHKKQNFFAQMMSRGGKPDGNTVSGARNGDGSRDAEGVERGRGLELAGAKWTFRDPLATADTGLEAIFDSVFSIGDEPAEVRRKKKQQQQQQQQQQKGLAYGGEVRSADYAAGGQQAVQSQQQHQRTQRSGAGNDGGEDGAGGALWSVLLWTIPLLLASFAVLTLSSSSRWPTILEQLGKLAEGFGLSASGFQVQLPAEDFLTTKRLTDAVNPHEPA